MRIFALIFLLVTVSLSASPLPDFPFVTVSGESSRQVKPDQAELSFSVLTFDQSAEQAQQQLDVSVAGVLAVLAKFKVNHERITSKEIDKTIKRARGKDYQQLAILGYEYRQRFEVSLANLASFSPLYNALLKLDNVTQVNSVFDVSTRETIEVELIAEAAKQAKLKAGQMAHGLGVKIDSVYAVNGQGSFNDFFATFGLNHSFGGAQYKRKSDASPFFAPKYIEINKRINVVYRLDD